MMHAEENYGFMSKYMYSSEIRSVLYVCVSIPYRKPQSYLLPMQGFPDTSPTRGSLELKGYQATCIRVVGLVHKLKGGQVAKKKTD